MITKWSSRDMNLLGDVGSKQWTPSIFLDTLDVGFSAAQRHTQREAEAPDRGVDHDRSSKRTGRLIKVGQR